jgi:hypothetical protein
MWWIRQYPESANDFSDLFALIGAANIPTSNPAYYDKMEALVDTEEWMRLSAIEHATGDWDSFFTQNQWNMYNYKPTMGKWTALKWDWNITLGSSGSWGSDPSQLFNVGSADPVMGTFQNYPPYRRAYLRALQDIANLAMNNALVNPLLEAKYAVFAANGLTTTSYGILVANPKVALEGWIGTMHNSLLATLTNQGVANLRFTASLVTVSNNLATLSGTAPLGVKTIWINGVPWPVRWPSVTTWQATLPLVPGTNVLSVVGVDIHSQPVSGASNSVAVTYPGAPSSPAGQVVFNEIMCNPALPGAEFLELFNASATTAFDLSGWQIPEVSYNFPSGSLISPGGFLVLAANRAAYAAAYGATVPLSETFPGTLDPNGGLLTLLSASQSSNAQVITRVRYSGSAPWPAVAAQVGTSLQLIDAHQDNWRAGNWSVSQTNSSGPQPPQWQYVTCTGTAPRPILLVCMHNTPGDVFIDDLKLVSGSVPEAGVNLLTNGDFESPLSGPWTVSANMTSSVISTAVKHSGNASLHVIATSAGDTVSQSIWENTAPIVTNDTYTLSYWYLPSTNGSQLLIRLSGTSPNNNQVYSLQNIQPLPYVPLATCTPAAPNSVAATLPAFPPLWINEIQADNLTGITNRAGQHAPWLELFNPTTNTVPLDGLYLANSVTNFTAWGFPADAVMNPGEFKVVFADGHANLSTSNELHTSFLLTSGSGSVALSRLYLGLPQVLDYIDYTNLLPNYSYGSFPDGQSFFRRAFAFATPGATNNAAIPSSFIPYASIGWIYTQDFDSLPNPGTTSVNTANPVTINSTTYSLANPLDFAFPASATGPGGLGLAQMAGWYGSAALLERFGATSGDQTAGGQLSFGMPGSSNRALGLLATSSTGATAFGAKFINQTTATLKYINLQVTGEVWRQSDLPKTLQCYYFIDLAGTATFPAGPTALLPSLNVDFPTAATAVGGVAVDGTAPANETNLTVISQAIADWPPGAALWLVWQMTDFTGKAQGLAIDNFSLSASDQPPYNHVSLSAQATDGNLIISWPTQSGQNYQVEYTEDLTSGAWSPLSGPLLGTGVPILVTNSLALSIQRFFRVKPVP